MKVSEPNTDRMMHDIDNRRDCGRRSPPSRTIRVHHHVPYGSTSSLWWLAGGAPGRHAAHACHVRHARVFLAPEGKVQYKLVHSPMRPPLIPSACADC